MSNFKIIPVLDILNSICVHAIKGERSQYLPLKSYMFGSSDPYNIIETLYNKYEFNEFYIADLDAIIKNHPNSEIIVSLLQNYDIRIMLDSGISTIEDISAISQFGIETIIIGLETLSDLKVIESTLSILGKQNIIVSIDMYLEKVITQINEFKFKSIPDIVKKIRDLGVYKIILLDLFRVGQKLGGITPLYLKIRNEFNGEIYVGGGIKDLSDIQTYYDNQFSGVLIGTALYDGTINIQKLRDLIYKYDTSTRNI
ncbi:MAG: HisA/HisF-related TIM barrel protein [Candidatus Lokiarchaeota archaeon]|nr:HisA/HisF-related TIM barrel protein [Candidatus Lokiarchaeota archaeon]